MPQILTGHVFVSYSRKDEEVMKRIVTFLRKRGIKLWVDNEKLIPGTPIWEEEIEKAIQGSAAIIVVLSPDAKNSEWVRREITFAERYHKRVFPVLVSGDEDSSFTLRLITRQYVDIREHEEIGINSLSAAVSFHLEELEAQEAKRLEAERAAAEKAAREAAEQAAKEQAERKASERLSAERQAAQLRENRQAAEKAEREAAELAARRKAEREAAEKAEREALLTAGGTNEQKFVNTSATADTIRKNQPVVKLAIGAIFGVFVLALGAWGISALSSPATVTPTVAVNTNSTAVMATARAAIFPQFTPTTIVAPTEQVSTKPAFGIILPSKDEARWIQDSTRFKDALTEKGYDVEVLFSQSDSAQEKTNVESLITQGVKVIILCPQDGAAAAAAAEAAHAAGVKVISYDRLILNTDAVDYYVTFDSTAVGAAQAQYLVDHATGTGNPLYLYAGAASDNNAFLFFEGAWNVLQPRIADGTFVVKNSSEAVALQNKATLTRDEMGRIIGQITTDWYAHIARNLAESNLTVASAADKGDVFILGPNDGTARAIADVFAVDSDVTSYVVTGQDAEIASIQYIIDGKQSMTVLKDVRILANDAITVAITFLEGKTPEHTMFYNNGTINIPSKPSEVITVDQSNVKAAIIDSGYWPASEFTGLP